jgi:hypothetical protein
MNRSAPQRSRRYSNAANVAPIYAPIVPSTIWRCLVVTQRSTPALASPYLRTFVLSYFRTFVLSYFRTSAHTFTRDRNPIALPHQSANAALRPCSQPAVCSRSRDARVQRLQNPAPCASLPTDPMQTLNTISPHFLQGRHREARRSVRCHRLSPIAQAAPSRSVDRRLNDRFTTR